MITPILATIITIALAWVAGAVILMIVSRLGLGLTVDGFGAAFIASAVISIVAAIIIWLLGLVGIQIGRTGPIPGIVGLLVTAVILLISDRFVKGMKVSGFGGAILAAIGYGVVTWALQWLISLFV